MKISYGKAYKRAKLRIILQWRLTCIPVSLIGMNKVDVVNVRI
jgi:hypothetical protein